MRSLAAKAIAAAAAAALCCACGPKPHPLPVAGSDKDEGHGILAQASTRFMTSAGGNHDTLGVGGATYGGAAYGGSTYGNYVVPSWPVTPPNRVPRYSQVPNLTGAIEGTVALRPAPTTSPCPAPRTALVYIEKVKVGRTLMNDASRPLGVGGTIFKRGCVLAPLVQIVSPLPAALAIHGDAKPATLRVAGKVFDLQPAGRVAIPLVAGETQVALEGGGTAYVLASDTPYYATTDDQGRYRLDELAPGTYEVTFWQPPFPPLKRSVRVDARRPTRLDIK